MTVNRVQIIVMVQSQVLQTVLTPYKNNNMTNCAGWQSRNKAGMLLLNIHKQVPWNIHNTTSYNQYMMTLPCKVFFFQKYTDKENNATVLPLV